MNRPSIFRLFKPTRHSASDRTNGQRFESTVGLDASLYHRSMALPGLDELLSPAIASNLESVDLDEVRSRRSRCQDAETSLSFLRRLIQGRLDIVMSEVGGRAGGTRGDLASLVEQLPQIFAEHDRPEGLGRPDTLDGPNDFGSELVAGLTTMLNSILNADQVGALRDIDDAELRRIADELSDLERAVSTQRGVLHERIDSLQAEIVRRYKTGEATVDGLLPD